MARIKGLKYPTKRQLIRMKPGKMREMADMHRALAEEYSRLHSEYSDLLMARADLEDKYPQFLKIINNYGITQTSQALRHMEELAKRVEKGIESVASTKDLKGQDGPLFSFNHRNRPLEIKVVRGDNHKYDRGRKDMSGDAI